VVGVVRGGGGGRGEGVGVGVGGNHSDKLSKPVFICSLAALLQSCMPGIPGITNEDLVVSY